MLLAHKLNKRVQRSSRSSRKIRRKLMQTTYHRHARSTPTAPMSEDCKPEALTQNTICATVSFCQSSDRNAVRQLHECPIIANQRPWCSTQSARKSHSANLQTITQYANCTNVSKPQRESRSSAHTNHNRIPNELPHDSALPASLLTQADLACVESTPCFQL